MPITKKITDFYSLWGPSAVSYAMLSVAQIIIGLSMSNSTAYLMVVLSLLGLVSAWVHKGKSFDEVRARGGKSILPFPWSYKTTHLVVCAAMLFLSSALPSSGLMRVPELSYVAAIFSILGGWFGGMAPTPEKSSAGIE
jgi:uncharacterized Tic20 family protein